MTCLEQNIDMLKKRGFIMGLLLSLMTLTAGAQRFFNLTVDDLQIDSMLPRFTYSVPLGYQYADSTYTVEILYPDFIDMSSADIAKYHAITTDDLPALPEIATQTAVERKQGKLELSFVPMVYRNGKYQFLVSFMLKVSAKPVNTPAALYKAPAAGANGAAQRYADHSVLASGRWVKISVPATGVYQLTPALIKQAGFTDFSRVKIYGYGGNLQNEQLVGSELAATDDLREVPTCMAGGKRLFYGKGPVSWSSNSATLRTRNPYADYGCYFLTESADEPLSVDSAAFVSSFYPAAEDYHSLHEVDNYSYHAYGRNLFENAPIRLGSSKTFTLTNRGLAASGQLAVCLTSAEKSGTTATVTLNGQELGTVTISVSDAHDVAGSATKVFTVDNLHATDTVIIKTTKGGPIYPDYIAMVYDTPCAAPQLSTASFPVPDYVYGIVNQDHHADEAADLIIIIPTTQKLLAQAQRLADFHREQDGLRVRIVPADELYNEFSSGTPDANAYRRYLKMLYDRAETEEDMPKYLLLFGNSVWDNRMNTSACARLNPDDYLLAFESENSFNTVYSYVNDGFYTLLDDGEGISMLTSDKEDMAVGRFPVTNADDAKIMVDKVISYKQNANAGGWQNTIMFMGDDGDSNMHMRDIDQTAEQMMALYPGYQMKKVMWDAYVRETSSTGSTYPEVERVIKQQQAAGALIMDYAGHGRPDQMSHESVLRLVDFSSFQNTNYPLWVTATCDLMPFDDLAESIGVNSVLNSKGGSVAFYGTTRTVLANYNKPINTAFMKYVLSYDKHGKPVTMGEAQRLAKNEMITAGGDRTQNKLQFALLGDPAMALNLPTATVVIDSVNGKPSSSSYTDAEMPTLKAGSVVTVNGHIEQNGSKMRDFNGTLTAMVRDTRELIVCKRNDPALVNSGVNPFTFYDRQNVLYNGSSSVTNGEFLFSFAVPMDINYADGTGLMNLYAVNTERSCIANGYYEQFYINGSESLKNDSIGPSVYCYLNSPSFVDGGTVNTTPYFVAQVTDKDGINASNSGIGHNMELIIDGDMRKTYDLNNNFTFDFGSYTSGTTYYNIPELEAGPHQLKFRAWDILNNSTTAVLNFHVVKGLQPDIYSVSCTNNPATTGTTFIVSHNRTGSYVDIGIDVFDTSGRLLWKHDESGVSTGNTYTVSWDLTVDGGRRLQTGVYLYRVRMSSDGSSYASKAKKLIIIGNN